MTEPNVPEMSEEESRAVLLGAEVLDQRNRVFIAKVEAKKQEKILDRLEEGLAYALSEVPEPERGIWMRLIGRSD